MVHIARRADGRGHPNPSLHARTIRARPHPGQDISAQSARPGDPALPHAPPWPQLAACRNLAGGPGRIRCRADRRPAGGMAEYGRREQNRREHALEAQRHLGLRQADKHDLRAALLAANAAADATDQGQPIAEAMISALRERRTLLPAVDMLDRLGRAARAIARRRMESALLDGLSAERSAAIDDLLAVDPAVGMTRFVIFMPFKLNASRRHRIGKMKFQVTNWREYEAGKG